MASPLMRPPDEGRPTIVVALGGNALLRRSEPMTADNQRRNVAVAARAIAPLTAEHRVVVAAPKRRRIVEMEAIRRLLESESIVICAGGGGIPTTAQAGRLDGVEAVIDKDLASELLAEAIGADLLVMATDVDGVYTGWGTAAQRRIDWVTPNDLEAHGFPAGSMGPKVDAAVRFASVTGRRAAIGSLDQIGDIVGGRAGTNVSADVAVGHPA